jgi:hypothetical protein
LRQIFIFCYKTQNFYSHQQKESGWEGSIRCNAILYAPFLPNSVVKEEFIHLADFLPTINTLANAGFKINKKLDGVDQSEILRKPFNVPKDQQLRNTVEVIGQGAYFYSAVIKNEFKYVNGSNWGGKWNEWYGVNQNVNVNSDKYEENLRNSETWKAIGKNVSERKIKKFRENAKVTCAYEKEVSRCDVTKAPCLFNILEDPCEQNNLANDAKYAEILQDMKNYHDQVAAGVVPARRVGVEKRSDPALWSGTWTWYMDLLEGKA